MVSEDIRSSDISRITEVEDAVRVLTGALDPVIGNDVVSLKDATGRILAEDIVAGMSVPSFPKSAMDGYAVRSSDISDASEDTPVRLKVIGCITAGDKIPADIRDRMDFEGCAVRIMTGAAVPDGFDTVIKQEDTDFGEDEVQIFKSQLPFVNYCKVGEDILEGRLIVPSGTRIGRAEAGVIASVGIPEVKVLRKIRISIISTGSEITDVGQPLEESKIYNNIAYLLMASLNKPPFETVYCCVPDDTDRITEAINIAKQTSDIIITTGGVSVGQKDLIPEAIVKVGAVKLFSGLNIKPGSPTIGAVIDGKALLCLSGNPFAATANFDLYAGNIIASITGCASYVPVREKAVLQNEFNKPSNVRRLIRANVNSGKVTIHSKALASSILRSYLGANCYVDIPRGSDIHAGDEVDIIRISEALL